MKRANEPGGIWVLEEATGLLRALPARSWTLFLAGTLPFTWLLIDFLMEMSRSAYGEERLVSRSLLLAALYVLKQSAQALFSRDCLQTLRGEAAGLPSAPALARLVLVQAAFQPLRLPALSAASLVVIPFPWVAGFLRNVGLSALERERGFVREAWRLGRGDARAHSVALVIISVCWLLLFLNFLALWFVVPLLLKAFFGWQTEFTRLAARLLNATTLLTTVVLTFLTLEPVHCAMAAVRAFYAKARSDGEDLRGVLRRLAAAMLIGALLLGGGGAGPGQAAAQEPGKVNQAALDQQIDDVLRQPEFAWRMPKQEEEKGESDWLRRLFRNIGSWVRWLFDLFEKLFLPDPPPTEAPGSGWSVRPRLLRWAMIGAAVLAAGCIVMILLSRRKQQKSKPAAPAVAEPAAANLADENVSPAQRAEDEWLRMADACAAEGDFRLAMRALHLAGLRYLGEKGWVTLQPAKTSLEYGRELARRLRDVPAALEGYWQGLRQYEGVWYGFGAAGAETYRTLRSTWEEMRRHA